MSRNRSLNLIKSWAALGVGDVFVRYRASVLGPAWILLANLFFIGALGIVYSTIFNIQIDQYLPFLVTGYLYWVFLSTSLVEIASSLVAYRFVLLNNAVPPICIFVRVLVRNLFVFVHAIPFLVIASWLTTGSFIWSALYAVISLLAGAIFVFCFGGMLAFTIARLRDVESVLTSSMSILFLVTPVIWSPDLFSGRTIFLDINPAYYFVESFRFAVLNGGAEGSVLKGVFALLLSSILSFVFIYRLFSRRYIYWL